MTNRGNSLFLIIIPFITAFGLEQVKSFEFSYPKRKGSNIVMTAPHFRKFSKEWRGSDYYYYSEQDGFICSVLFYKLDEEEKLKLVEVPRAAIGRAGKSPAYPYAYFKNYSNLKSMEVNDSSWGAPTDDFMFRQNLIRVEGTGFSQRHMYGYAMADEDLFVNVHISMINPSAQDSTNMINMLKSLKFGK